MAVTPVGNPYVESSDLVANYPGASEALAERIDIVGVNPFANAAARDAAIPSPVQGQMCSLNDDNKGYRYDGSAWVLFSGAGDANFTNAATGTYTDGGINYKYITFTGSGELIVDQAGFADILVIGGGGSGGESRGGGGGAGGYLAVTSAYLSATTHTVTVGAGGAGATGANYHVGFNGLSSNVGPFYGVGGGRGGALSRPRDGGAGGSGGGGGIVSGAGGSGTAGQGNAGGAQSSGSGGGGGGGANAAGANGGAAGGNGGAGESSGITGSSVTRAGGGGGGNHGGTAGTGGTGGGGAGSTSNALSTAGTVNTGGGSGGGGYTSGVGGSTAAGGSGLVIIRVVV